MSNQDNKTQTMQVTVTYRYQEEIFDGENDMYAVADDAKKYIERDFERFLSDGGSVSDIEVKVIPKLT